MTIDELEHVSDVPLFAERMTFADVAEVTKLARVCFATPWSATTFERDLAQNQRSRYWVVRPSPLHRPESPPYTTTHRHRVPPIVAYGGYWLMANEIHIVTLATDPQWRRRRLATWVLLLMLEDARRHGGTLATLEVRESNVAAFKLYARLGFDQVGRRKGYYTVNRQSGEREDALLLALEGLDEGAVWRPLQQMMAELARENVKGMTG